MEIFYAFRIGLIGNAFVLGAVFVFALGKRFNKVYQAAQKGNKNAMLVSKEKACTLCSHYGHISEYCPLVGEKRTI